MTVRVCPCGATVYDLPHDGGRVVLDTIDVPAGAWDITPAGRAQPLPGGGPGYAEHACRTQCDGQADLFGTAP